MNTLALSNNQPLNDNSKYFFVDIPIDEEVQFVNSKNWASGFEVSPTEGNLLIANPIGNQQGLGVIGFCYVPYHFVYDLKYPVLVQISKNGETFQFPLAVIILKNQPKNASTMQVQSSAMKLCSNKNALVNVKTYDSKSNPVSAHISYECFGQTCAIGDSSLGILNSKFPQCVNGYVVAKADGFKETKVLLSTNTENRVDVLMTKLHNLNVNLKLNQASVEKAIIYFQSDDDFQVLSYPSQKKISLTEGTYNISVQIYKNSSMQMAEMTSQQCLDLPGSLGVKEKNCFDVNVPAQIVSNLLIGGGSSEYSFSENNLENSRNLELNVIWSRVPTTINELQDNYLLLEGKKIEVSLK